MFISRILDADLVAEVVVEEHSGLGLPKRCRADDSHKGGIVEEWHLVGHRGSKKHHVAWEIYKHMNISLMLLLLPDVNTLAGQEEAPLGRASRTLLNCCLASLIGRRSIVSGTSLAILLVLSTFFWTTAIICYTH